jgi:hypothetical protein
MACVMMMSHCATSLQMQLIRYSIAKKKKKLK